MVKINRKKSFDEGLEEFLKDFPVEHREEKSIAYLLECAAPTPFLELKINGKIILSIKRTYSNKW